MGFEVKCDDCGARFALGDDLYTRKVKGRIVTIKCKKCGHGISVDGTLSAASASDLPPVEEAPHATAVITEAPVVAERGLDLTPTVPLGSPSVGVWLVSFADDDDRELTKDQISEALRKGDIAEDTIVWRDGMGDWLPIAEVAELSDAVSRARVKKGATIGSAATGGFLGTGANVGSATKPGARLPSPPAAPRPAQASPAVAATPAAAEQDDAVPISIEPESLDSGALQELSLAEEPGAKAVAPVAPASPKPPPAARALSSGTLGSEKPFPKPPAALKIGVKPSAPERDAQATKTTSPAPATAIAEPAQPPDAGANKPTLPEPKRKRLPTPPVAPTPLRKTAVLGTPAEQPSSPGVPLLQSLIKGSAKDKHDRADEDILGLGGGAPMVPIALIDPEAPLPPPELDIAALDHPEPIADEPPPSTKSSAKKKKKKSIRPPGAVAATAVEQRSSSLSRGGETPGATAKEDEKKAFPVMWLLVAAVAAVAVWFLFLRGDSTSEPKPAEAAKPGVAATSEPVRPAPVATAEEAPPSPPPTAAPADDEPAPAAPIARGPGPSPTPGPKPEGAVAVPTPGPALPAPDPGPTEPPKPVDAPPKAVSLGGAFDKAAAASALSAAAGAASGCRQPQDPTGSARVTVTFAESGRVTSANVSGPPFAGTATGGCIAARMRSARVPPFSGGPVTVGKTVVIR